jgi:hypothetical protein
MVDFNEFKWDMHNIHDFKKWVNDNQSKTDEGCEAMQAVMKIGPEIASAAAVKWFRESGKYGPQEVADMGGKIVDKIIAACEKKQESVIRDSASMFAGSGQVSLVVMMTFVSYSLIGVEVASELMKK